MRSVSLDATPPPNPFSYFGRFNDTKQRPSVVAPAAKVSVLHTWFSEARSCIDGQGKGLVPNLVSGAEEWPT